MAYERKMIYWYMFHKNVQLKLFEYMQILFQLLFDKDIQLKNEMERQSICYLSNWFIPIVPFYIHLLHIYSTDFSLSADIPLDYLGMADIFCILTLCKQLASCMNLISKYNQSTINAEKCISFLINIKILSFKTVLVLKVNH